MKSKFPTIIMNIIIILIMCVFILFGYIFFEEFVQLPTSVEPENFQTIISENSNTIDTNIETPQIIENPLNDIEQSQKNGQKVDYSNVQVDKYFYNQLEDEAKTIYKALEANQENLKTGTYKIELGDTFSSVLSKANGQDELGRYYQSAIEAYTYDNPEVFYLSPNKMYLNIETTTTGNKSIYYVYINSGSESNYLIDEFSSEQQIDEAINKIEKVKQSLVAKKTGDTYQDIKMVHDYLVDNIEYDTTIAKANIYDAYGALINHVAVCEGYARSFKYIMDSMQIPCVLVIGKGTNSEGKTENHAWNYVQVEGTWYAIDTTWDDPVVSGGGKVSNESKYRYFLKGSNNFNRDHIPSGQFTPDGKVFEYPNISSQDL
ncbi:MAG: transglutaminase domain-containing protein [Clostridia bacterium]